MRAAGPVLTAQGVRIPGMSKKAVAELIGRLAAAGVELHEVRREAQSPGVDMQEDLDRVRAAFEVV